MIPKTIHYVWLGGGKNNFTNICINSWHENMPDYEIIEWNEHNLDLDKICKENLFFAECRKRKLWAFMADYLRLYVLYNYGGIYLDVDVQAIKSFSPLLNNNLFIGYEYCTRLGEGVVTHGTGVIACEAKNPVIKKCLDFYDTDIWNSDIYYVPSILTRVFDETEEDKYRIYPVDYFAPYDFRKKQFNRNCITENTYAIHWFEGSWKDNIEIARFLKIKHIKNPIKKKFCQIKNIVIYYKHKYLN